jgi:putative aldouronate transport system permease protein
MAAPAFVYMLIFNYAPMAGVLLAFKNYNIQKGFFRSDFIGFRNFRFLFETTDAYVITRNTILYFFAYLITGTLLALITSIMLSMLRSRRAAKTLQTFYLMPYFLSWSVIAVAVNALISQGGAVDQMLQACRCFP